MSINRRLTGPIKDTLGRKLLERAYSAKLENLVGRCSAFAIAVYEDAMGRDTLEKIAALPEGWLPSTNAVKVQFGSEIQQVYFNGSLNKYALPSALKRGGIRDHLQNITRRFPSRFSLNVSKVYEDDAPLARTFRLLLGEFDALEVDMKRAQMLARATMDSCSTVSRLQRVWPEVTPILKEIIKIDEPIQLPDVSRAELNKMLELPVED